MLDALDIGRKILAAQGFSRLLGAELTAFGPGTAELTLALRDEHRQQHGFAHGGVIAYLADNALTFAGGTALGGSALTLEMKINYLRPGQGERLVARAEVLGAGKRQAVCTCKVYAVRDGAEVLIAAAQGTILTADVPVIAPRVAPGS